MQFAVIDSNTEIQEVNAANPASTKNKIPMNLPIFPMLKNTFGRDTNISPGPADIPSSPEKTNTAGMIITPAKNATPVSINSIWDTALFRSTSFFT